MGGAVVGERGGRGRGKGDAGLQSTPANETLRLQSDAANDPKTIVIHQNVLFEGEETGIEGEEEEVEYGEEEQNDSSSGGDDGEDKGGDGNNEEDRLSHRRKAATGGDARQEIPQSHSKTHSVTASPRESQQLQHRHSKTASLRTSPNQERLRAGMDSGNATVKGPVVSAPVVIDTEAETAEWVGKQREVEREVGGQRMMMGPSREVENVAKSASGGLLQVSTQNERAAIGSTSTFAPSVRTQTASGSPRGSMSAGIGATALINTSKAGGGSGNELMGMSSMSANTRVSAAAVCSQQLRLNTDTQSQMIPPSKAVGQSPTGQRRHCHTHSKAGSVSPREDFGFQTNQTEVEYLRQQLLQADIRRETEVNEKEKDERRILEREKERWRLAYEEEMKLRINVEKQKERCDGTRFSR
jgi:hypothetical protein